jgi:hypothetical protein
MWFIGHALLCFKLYQSSFYFNEVTLLVYFFIYLFFWSKEAIFVGGGWNIHGRTWVWYSSHYWGQKGLCWHVGLGSKV